MSHQENAQKSRSFMVFLAQNHMELHGIEVKKIRENKLENTENVGYNPTPHLNPTPYPSPEILNI